LSTRKRIPELSAIPFTGAQSITSYSKEGRGICRELTWEFEMAAEEVYAALVASQKGNPLLFGVDVKRRANRVRKRLLRAAESTAEAGAELVRFHAQFRKEFADVLRPPAAKKPRFDFDDE
jgi:hypothetical protein